MWRLLVLSFVAVAHAQYETYLLPRTIKPNHYELTYVFDMDANTNFSYYGLVDIFFTAKASESKILLHMQDFNIQEDGIMIKSKKQKLEVKKIQQNTTFNFLDLSLSEKMMENEEYQLRIPFYGNLHLGLDGIYISSYKDSSTEEKQYLIATQFEAISARKAFPCLDEPMYKATFSIVIGHHKDFTALSNMPLANTTKGNALQEAWSWDEIKSTFKKDESEFVWDRFEKSVRMSTYLVAFVVSKFSYVESDPSLSHTKFRIWARKDAINQTTYAATIGPKILSAFEEFFNVSFPLPKQDMIAIPDFAAGAMENWGLITYRETSLLYDREDTSFVLKEKVAEVVAHELAHQWFGNLVTMKWWSDLWLSEGFATYVSTLGVEKIHPDWQSAEITEIENIQYVMTSDALDSSHPVSVEIEDPNRISEIFDEISYRKGATLIRMMNKFLGEEVFRRGLHEYLIHFSYNNAQQDDLWYFLTKVSMQYGGLRSQGQNVSISDVMNSWTKQTGFPLLTLTRNYEDNTLDLTQRRYVHIGALSSTKVSWWVPLAVLCQREAGSATPPPVWLPDTDGVTDKYRFEHGSNASEWVLFNYNMIAPYRVNYDQRNWQLLINTLHSDKYDTIPMTGRVQLLSDAFALAWTNHLDYSTALKLLDYLHREKEYLPIHIGLRQLVKIDNLLKRSADYGAFQKFVRKLITEQYQQAGGLAVKKIINPDDMLSVKMQTMTSVWACSAEVPGCEENAVQLFKSWMETKDPDNNNPIPLDLRKTVYCTAISRGGVVQWRFLLERLRRTNVAAARIAFQRALSCTREIWIIAQYLEMAVSPDSEIRSQDVASVISDMASAPIGYYIAKDFIYTRTADIIKAVQGQQRKIGQVFKVLLNQFTTQKELDEFLEWKKKNCKYLEQSKQAIAQAIESAKINIDWIKRNRKLVAEKLREFS